jgi:hypothetical protein
LGGSTYRNTSEDTKPVGHTEHKHLSIIIKTTLTTINNTNLIQHDLRGQPLQKYDNKSWGHKLPEKVETGLWRIGFQNTGPQRPDIHAPHLKHTISSIQKGKYDVFLFVEHSLQWSSVKPKSQWQERVHFHFLATHLVTTHNRNGKQAINSPFLAGGTGLTLFEDVTSRQVKSGINTSGLRRWSWSLVRQKADFTTRFISAY